MGIFNFNRQKKAESNQSADNGYSYQGFSSPFLKIGKGDLSKPYINSSFRGAGGFIRFSNDESNDNLYPQLINQLYQISPTHQQIVDFKVNTTIGGGWQFKNEFATIKEKVDFETFALINNFEDLITKITYDYVMHSRVNCKLTFNKDKKLTKIKPVNPARTRYDLDVEKVFYSSNWVTGRNEEILKKYAPSNTDKEQMYIHQLIINDTDPYVIPSYTSAANSIFLDSQIPLLQKSNIINSIFPSIIISVPKRFKSKEEADLYFGGLTAAKGSENAGKVGVIQAESPELMPTIDQLNTSNNDKLFKDTQRDVKENICIAHGINIAIVGLAVAGQLGNVQQVEQTYVIFEKNIIMPLRRKIEQIINEILKIAGINNKIEFKNFQIIEGQIQQKTNPGGTE